MRSQPAQRRQRARRRGGSVAAQDQLLQAIPGSSIHFVYAYPADGADRAGDFTSAMQTDAEAIDAWWRAQDAARTPRFDTFSFSCGAQLDISETKLPQNGAELTSSRESYRVMVGDLVAAGYSSRGKVYVVYYDGPWDGSTVCGRGGTSNPVAGPGYAIVFTRACPNIPTAVTAAHELTHGLGAVKSPAPHECPPPDDLHVCDSQQDLMYPFLGRSLSSVQLDSGRDDYYGVSGVGFDVRASPWLRHLDQPQAHVSVRMTGTGSVTTDLPGIACTASCESDWDGGQMMILFAEPGPGMRFVRWGGGCTGDGGCVISLAGPTAVTALFAPAEYRLTVGVQGAGRVSNSATPTACLKRCSFPTTSYQPVSLRAVASPGWRFKRWLGSCHGTRPTCSLPMSGNTSASAQFVKKAKAR